MIKGKHDYYVIDDMYRDGEYLTFLHYDDIRELQRTRSLNWNFYGPFDSLLEKFNAGALVIYCPELVKFYYMECCK